MCGFRAKAPRSVSPTSTYSLSESKLRGAFARNPHMRLFVAFGYYDAATPYFAAEYSLEHLRLDPSLKGSIKRGYYPAGHMMYIHQPSLVQLRKDVGDFVGTR